MLFGSVQGSRRAERCRHHCSRLQHFGLPRTRKGEVELNFAEAWEEKLLILPPNVFPLWSQIEGLGRLIWIHIDKEERHKIGV